jgi:gliding-associated putative ABC transporter substrate-binding component GldG
MPFSSTIDTLKNNVKKTVLISSSNFSQSLQPPLAIDIKEATEKLNPEDYKLKAQAMGVLLEGEFPSAFENRVKPVKLDQRKENGSSEMMVFSSGTVAENQLENGEPLELGFDKWTRNFYFNKTFLRQTVHYLMGNKELIDVKNKTVELPRLNIEKINNISPSIKIFLLLTPLLLLLFFGGLMHWFRTRKFGQ